MASSNNWTSVNPNTLDHNNADVSYNRPLENGDILFWSSSANKWINSDTYTSYQFIWNSSNTLIPGDGKFSTFDSTSLSISEVNSDQIGTDFNIEVMRLHLKAGKIRIYDLNDVEQAVLTKTNLQTVTKFAKYIDVAGTVSITGTLNNGQAYKLVIEISVPSVLNDLADVNHSAVDGHALVFAAGVWGSAPLSGGGATVLDDLTDVTLSVPLEGQTLRYNGSQWVNNGILAINNLDTVSIVTPDVINQITSGISKQILIGSTGTNSQIVFQPDAGANSIIRMATGFKSAVQYATDISSTPSAVPNVQYVTNAISAIPAPVSSLGVMERYGGSISTPLQDIPVQITGLTLISAGNFTVGSDTVTYIGSSGKFFRAVLNVEAYQSVADTRTYWQVKVNGGTTSTNLLHYSKNSTSFSESTGSVSNIFQLNNGDVISLWVERKEGGAVSTSHTTDSIQFSINSF